MATFEMAYWKIARFILFPAVLLAQDARLSDAAKKLISKPRLGNAQLTWTDGRTQDGRIISGVRPMSGGVSGQFVAFETRTVPAVCENVELSKLAAVQWLSTVSDASAVSSAVGAVYAAAVLTPSYIAGVVTGPFKRMSPPLKPLRGSWELDGDPDGAHEESLVFRRRTVRYQTVTSKRGRWSVERGLLHLRFDGEPESVTSFHFDCDELVLDNPIRENPIRRLREWGNAKQAKPPLAGDWRGANYRLDLMPNGSVVAQYWEVLNGTFENTATSVTLHWTDAMAPGGSEWVAQIKKGHIFLNVRGVPTKYRYAPSWIEMD